MNKKIAFFSTIFLENKKYIPDFFNSLVDQTYSLFDVVIVNDGYDEQEQLIEQYSSLNIVIFKIFSLKNK